MPALYYGIFLCAEQPVQGGKFSLEDTDAFKINNLYYEQILDPVAAALTKRIVHTKWNFIRNFRDLCWAKHRSIANNLWTNFHPSRLHGILCFSTIALFVDRQC